MDPYFRQRHGSGPSPHDDSSPHSVTSQYRNQFGAPAAQHHTGGSTSSNNTHTNHNHGHGHNALEHLLQSPQDLKSAFNRFNTNNPAAASAAASTMDNFSSLLNANARQDGGFDSFSYAQPQASTSGTSVQQQQQAGPTGKRGSKACVACRKGKNRCEGDPTGQNGPCRRCMLNNIPCVYEKAGERKGHGRASTSGPEGFTGEAEGRVTNLENSVRDLAQGQNQIQNALQRILSMLPTGQNPVGPLSTPSSVPSFLSNPPDGSGAISTASIFQHNVSPPGAFPNASPSNGFQLPVTGFSPQNYAGGRGSTERRRPKEDFPKLPGFAPPDHQFGTYGIIPVASAAPSPAGSPRSRASSVSAASDSGLAHDSLTAPIQALETLANAADQATAIAGDAGGDSRRDSGSDEERKGRKRKRVTIDAKNIQLRVKKKTKPDPTPRNPFPDVVTKGLVSEAEARELWDVFFSGCHYFVPLWDKAYDTYESYIERTPFSTNGLLAVAAKIRAGNGPLGQTFHRCLEEAQGIARSTLFGPIVRKEAVMAMVILSMWSQNGWLPCGHALRMALDMNLHRALDSLADTTKERSDHDERELVVSARIWLNVYMNDHLVSLGTAKPLMMRDDSSVKRARTLLSHPMASETDPRLVAGVELVNIRVRVVEHLGPLHGKVDAQTISFVKRIFSDLQDWYHEWHQIHRQRYDEQAILVKILEVELVYAQLWTVTVALRGVQWDKLPREQRELAFQAKDASLRCLDIFLRAENFRKHLKYATHDQLVMVSFAAVFLLKIAILYPTEIQLPHLISQVSELAHVLSAECFAERYALTLRLMLSNFRRKTGALSTVPGTPRITAGDDHAAASAFAGAWDDAGLQSLLSLPQMAGGDGNGGFEGMGGDWGTAPLNDGFAWPTEFSPSNLPVWLQDGNFTDLGLPQDGSDSLFLPLELANMFLPSGTQSNANYSFAFPDTGDAGAEAW